MTAPSPRISLERTYSATVDELWSQWTTPEGIESWWGPEGFSVKVHTLDLKPRGQLRYSMSATAPEQIEFMRSQNMPVTTEATITFVAIEPKRHLAYEHLVDSVPELAPYLVTTDVELMPTPGGGVRMVLTHDQMHDDVWTQRARLGWENQLGKLDRALKQRSVG